MKNEHMIDKWQRIILKTDDYSIKPCQMNHHKIRKIRMISHFLSGE